MALVPTSASAGCADDATAVRTKCIKDATDRERDAGPRPGGGVSLRLQLKLSFCNQDYERAMEACGSPVSDKKPADDAAKPAERKAGDREPLLVMCDESADGACHVVFKEPTGEKKCGQLPKTEVSAKGGVPDLKSPSLEVAGLEKCPDDVLAEHARDKSMHAGPDLKEAVSKIDFDCLDDDPSARWEAGRCYGVVKELTGVPRCGSVAKERVRIRPDGTPTAHRWDIRTEPLGECPQKIWRLYQTYARDCEVLGVYGVTCPMPDRALWSVPTYTWRAVRPVVPVRAAPPAAPVPGRAAAPAPVDRGVDKGKSDVSKSTITGIGGERTPPATRTMEELFSKPEPPAAPVERRVGGVKVDVESKGKTEDLSSERNEILKMRRGP